MKIVYSCNDPNIANYISNMLVKREKMEQMAKYKVGSMIKLTDDWQEIANTLVPIYNTIDAKRIGKTLCGGIVEICSIEELTNNGIRGTYYSVFDEDGLMWCFPEKLFVD